MEEGERKKEKINKIELPYSISDNSNSSTTTGRSTSTCSDDSIIIGEFEQQLKLICDSIHSEHADYQSLKWGMYSSILYY